MSRKTLSVFVDESGDFGKIDPKSPNYYVAFVFHNQSIDISENIRKLDKYIQQQDYPPHAIHTGPIIRREKVYKNDIMEKRKALFNSLFHFARKLDIHYLCPRINKQECDGGLNSYISRLSRAIFDELKAHYDYFKTFDLIINYYDNGQDELTKILISVFTTLFPTVEFRKVKPVDYKLFQVADLICTMELTKDKADKNEFSNSEKEFFHSPKDFKKNLYKQLEKKKLGYKK